MQQYKVATLADTILVDQSSIDNAHFPGLQPLIKGATTVVKALTNVLGGTPADLDVDGCVGGADLTLMLSSWGQPTHDIDGNGTVDGVDLALLLGAWSCP